MQENRMPVLFIGHGSPMNAIENNEFTQAWERIAAEIPRPKAILCISAHWETLGLHATANMHPKTIHDFYGFPRALFEVQYPAPGDADLVEQVAREVTAAPVQPDATWGLDHGAWSVLCRMYPAAEIPVVQLSLDRSRQAVFHYELGRQLRALREEGVLILGSGNIVHNLRLVIFEDRAFDWAVQFDAQARDWIRAGEHEPLIHYEKLGKPAELAINSAEHYLPLLYVLGAAQAGEAVQFYAEKVWGGSLSMRCVRVG